MVVIAASTGIGSGNLPSQKITADFDLHTRRLNQESNTSEYQNDWNCSSVNCSSCSSFVVRVGCDWFVFVMQLTQLSR